MKNSLFLFLSAVLLMFSSCGSTAPEPDGEKMPTPDTEIQDRQPPALTPSDSNTEPAAQAEAGNEIEMEAALDGLRKNAASLEASSNAMDIDESPM